MPARTGIGTISPSEQAIFDALQGAGVAEHGEAVLILAADGIEFGNGLGGDAHVVAVENLVEGVVDHQVIDLADPGEFHAVAPAGLGQGHGHHAHVFLTAGQHHLCLSGHDRLGAKRDGLEAGAADLVDGEGGGFLGDSGLDHGLAGRVLALAGLEDVAHDDLINGDLSGGGIPGVIFFFQFDLALILELDRCHCPHSRTCGRPESSFAQGLAHDGCSQGDNRRTFQAAAKGADRCPASAYNYNLVHRSLAPLFLLAHCG